jgi:hypothetical protein
MPWRCAASGCQLGRRRRRVVGSPAIDGENSLGNSGRRRGAPLGRPRVPTGIGSYGWRTDRRGSEGLKFHAGKHISIFMRTTFDLPDELMKRAKIAAVKRGSSLRDLVAEALSRLLAEQSSPKRKRMTEAPIKLPPGHTIPIRSNSEIAQLFDQEDITHLNDVYSGR